MKPAGAERSNSLRRVVAAWSSTGRQNDDYYASDIILDVTGDVVAVGTVNMSVAVDIPMMSVSLFASVC